MVTMARHKYNARSMNIDNIKFSSKKEAGYYMHLRKRKLDGEVKYFLRKVPFDLGRSGTYICDFLVVWADDTVSFEDVKLPLSLHLVNNKNLAELKYNVKINQV